VQDVLQPHAGEDLPQVCVTAVCLSHCAPGLKQGAAERISQEEEEPPGRIRITAAQNVRNQPDTMPPRFWMQTTCPRFFAGRSQSLWCLEQRSGVAPLELSGPVPQRSGIFAAVKRRSVS